jgi:hypothetical protein
LALVEVPFVDGQLRVFVETRPTRLVVLFEGLVVVLEGAETEGLVQVGRGR